MFSIRRLGDREGGGSVWTRAGSAFVNRDGSLNVLLDVLPIDGKLHVREAADKRDEKGPPVTALPDTATSVAFAGGH